MKPGIPALRLLTLSGLFALSAPALAIDCKKASTDVEKLICSNRGAVSADAELNRNYSALLKQAPDAEIRAMLVASQKRWVAARDQALTTLIDSPDALPDGKTSAQAARDLILARSAQFKKTAKGDSVPRIIGTALEQRKFLSQFTGGAYAGYQTSCDVLPRDYTDYSCFATRHYQNNGRVCSVDEYWASGGVYTKRYVADIVNGKPKTIASCSFSSSDEACHDSDGKTKWNRAPSQPERGYPANALPKIDGEVYDADDYEWAQACLADPAYPTAQ
ncbi:lysozyme inhibitor LprI family protein [Achromobacter sp.]|uniref:lysozyme inhibitor LprI family protein n=1 Tax=Achromobacter sp. TaxID=134375 RepID=UPI0028AB0980|nr:lysozyme inhibitor LprI family protein [Achromobacter sp.]